MMKKICLMLFVLITMISLAFAAPSVTNNYPTVGTTIWGGHTVTFDFNVIDENTDYHAGTPNTLQVYFSTISGARQILVINDTNLQDATTVLCADYNFLTSKDCNVSFVVPSFDTIPMGIYYADYNFGANVAGVITPYYTSSSRFNINQGMPASVASMIGLALFIAAAGLAVFFAFRLIKGESTINQGIEVAIVVTILLVVGWTLYGVVVAPI